MTQKITWLRRLHRVHAALTLSVMLTLLLLGIMGAITGSEAVKLFLIVEVPLLAIFIAITIMRLRSLILAKGSTDSSLLQVLETEEPLLRGATAELRAFSSLFMLMAGKKRVAPDATSFGYARGTMAVPMVLLILSAFEIVVVHLLLPWHWLRLSLLVLTLWGMLFLLGYLASRVTHPHVINDGSLNLRWGHIQVLNTPVTNIVTAEHRMNYTYSQPHVEESRLILTSFQSTNTLIRFAEPVRAVAPVAKKHLPADFHASEVLLYLEDPKAFIDALSPIPDAVAT